jgi:hypothetical protein
MKLLHHIGVELTAVKREARVALEKKRHARSNVPAWPGRLQFSVKLSARPSKRPVSGSVQAAAAAKKRRPCPCRPPLPLNSDHVLFHSASREGTPSHDAVCSASDSSYARVYTFGTEFSIPAAACASFQISIYYKINFK